MGSISTIIITKIQTTIIKKNRLKTQTKPTIHLQQTILTKIKPTIQ